MSARALIVVALAACGGGAAKSPPRTSVADVEKASFFTFDWAPPCRVPVRDVFVRVDVERREIKSMFVLDVSARGDELFVDQKEEALLEYNGVDLSTPEMQAQVADLQTVLSYTPGFFISKAGAFVRADSLDEARLADLHPELAMAIRQHLMHPSAERTLPFKHEWEWRTLVGAWLDWTVPKGESKLVAGDAAHGRARLEHLGDVDRGVKLRRTESIESGEWTITLASLVVHLLGQSGVAPEKIETLAREALGEASMEIVYEAVIDPKMLRPKSASFAMVQRVTVAGIPVEVTESRTYELDWAAAKGCGEVKAGR